MSTKKYFFSIITLSSFIMICIFSTNKQINISSTPSRQFNTIPTELPIATLIIDDIKLKQDIYSIKSKENTVDKNVQLLKESVLPQNNNESIVFLAAHSGNSNISYFGKLNLLSKKSIIKFNYNNYIYSYLVKNIYSENKDGDIEVNKNFKNELILTTCNPTDKNKQLIISSKLIKKEKV